MKKVIGLLLLVVFTFSSCTKSKADELVIPVTEQLSTPQTEQVIIPPVGQVLTPSMPEEQSYSEDDKLLILAVKENDIESAASLLNKGANPNIVLDDGRSLLQWVLRYNDQPLTLVRLLVEKGSDVNYNGVSSVFSTAISRLSDETLSAEIVPLFENAGLDFLGKALLYDKLGSYFQCLVYRERPKTALLFLTHDEVLQEVLADSSMVGWLIGMQRPGTKEILEYLAANGLQLNTDEPLLYEAIWNDDYDAVLFLLDNGVSPTKRYAENKFCNDDRTPLEFAKDNIVRISKLIRMFNDTEDESSQESVEDRNIIRLLEERIVAEEAAKEQKAVLNE